jgi:hypothetical protein
MENEIQIRVICGCEVATITGNMVVVADTLRCMIEVMHYKPEVHMIEISYSAFVVPSDAEKEAMEYVLEQASNVYVSAKSMVDEFLKEL